MTPKASRKGGRLERILSSRPTRLWPDRLVHHGMRYLLLLALATLVALLFRPAPPPAVVRYEVGMVAQEDVTARIAFAVPKTPEELEAERTSAAEAVPPTFRFRPEAGERMLSNVQGFFDALDGAAGEGPGAVEEELSSSGIRGTLRQVELLTDPQARASVRRAVIRAAREVHPDGVVDASQVGYLTTPRFTVREADGEERTVPSEQVRSTRQFFDEAVAFLPPGTSPELEELVRLILIRFNEANYVLDAVETFKDKDQARSLVSAYGPSVLPGEVILRRGERVRESHQLRLQAYEDALRSQGQLEGENRLYWLPLLGAILLNSLVLLGFGLMIRFYRPEVYTNFRWVLLQAALVAVYFVVASRIGALDLPAELLPITFVALTLAVLWDARQALVLALVLAILTALQTPFQDPRILAFLVVGGGASAFSVRTIRRRAQTWAAIAVITLAHALTLLSLALIFDRDAVETLRLLGYAALNTTVSAILAMGFLPVWEWYTRITTDQSLLEWADPNRPLLKRLSLEAPGTYAHSVNVANLAEASAEAIGANGLLCRVGAYYHDVGKVLKPQFFIENQPGGRNPHDKLKPGTSAGIVREHVTEGLRLAREENVPDVVEPFVLEHHGTQLIGFFYEKALEEADPDDPPDPAAFTYPGPRPRSRETAILMVADSVESATKVLQDPTEERIRDLVEGLVRTKMDSGQFDEAPITLGELEQVKGVMVKLVSGMFHHRIDYPQTRHLTDADGDAAP